MGLPRPSIPIYFLQHIRCTRTDGQSSPSLTSIMSVQPSPAPSPSPSTSSSLVPPSSHQTYDTEVPGIYSSNHITLDVPIAGEGGRPPAVKYMCAFLPAEVPRNPNFLHLGPHPPTTRHSDITNELLLLRGVSAQGRGSRSLLVEGRLVLYIWP